MYYRNYNIAGLLALLVTLFLFSATLFAQTDIYVRGAGKLFPIALPQLCLQAGESSGPREIPRIIARDLDLSGYFEVLNPEAYIETPGKCGGAESVVYSDWSVIGAEGLVRGTLSVVNNLVRVQLYLHDVQRRAVVLGKEYEGDESQIGKIAHRFANEILKFFTGEAGVFGTQIAFTSRVGRFKELFVMDMDGSNVRQLTNDRGLAMSATWDPSWRMLAYTSYRSRTPDLFLIDVFSREIRQLTRSDAHEIGPQFFRDGASILTSISGGRDSDIVLLNPDGTVARRLAPGQGAINVSPDWAPDYSRIVFCSNRGGSPQIYTMNADGSEQKRISFVRSNYCTSPRWSPKGDKLAFVCRADAGFQLFIANADGSDPQQLTAVGTNEDPDWSPDGRLVVFATTFGRGHATSLAIIRPDGTNLRQITQSRAGDSAPAWGPVVP